MARCCVGFPLVSQVDHGHVVTSLVATSFVLCRLVAIICCVFDIDRSFRRTAKSRPRSDIVRLRPWLLLEADRNRESPTRCVGHKVDSRRSMVRRRGSMCSCCLGVPSGVAIVLRKHSTDIFVCTSSCGLRYEPPYTDSFRSPSHVFFSAWNVCSFTYILHHAGPWCGLILARASPRIISHGHACYWLFSLRAGQPPTFFALGAEGRILPCGKDQDRKIQMERSHRMGATQMGQGYVRDIPDPLTGQAGAKGRRGWYG